MWFMYIRNSEIRTDIEWEKRKISWNLFKIFVYTVIAVDYSYNWKLRAFSIEFFIFIGKYLDLSPAK